MGVAGRSLVKSQILEVSRTNLYSFVITIDRVSTDSRGAAFFGARGFINETCGQTGMRPLVLC